MCACVQGREGLPDPLRVPGETERLQVIFSLRKRIIIRRSSGLVGFMDMLTWQGGDHASLLCCPARIVFGGLPREPFLPRL